MFTLPATGAALAAIVPVDVVMTSLPVSVPAVATGVTPINENIL
jgi:hypothetical protein